MAENPVFQLRPVQCCAKFRKAVAIPYFQESCELEEELRFVQGFCEMAGHSQGFEQLDEMLFSVGSLPREHMQRRRIIEHFFFQTRLDPKEINPARLAGELTRLRVRVLGEDGPMRPKAEHHGFSRG